MKKTSLSFMILIMAMLLVISVGLAGCTSQAPAARPVPGIIPSTLEPSAMALQPADVPANFTFVENGERNASWMSNWSLDHGWKKGYYAIYQMNNRSSRPGAVVEQLISVYNPENITLIVPDTIGMTRNWSIEDKNVTVEELPRPAIGDTACSFRIVDMSNDFAWYRVAFVKKDVYMEIWTNGTAAEYDSFLKIADTAAAKIQ
jgi:hypothetical protein